jgi:hypothetical protein
MMHPLIARRRAAPIRLSLTDELGHDIDGAWWPRTDRIGTELPELIVALNGRVGDVSDIGVNWPPLQRPPDLNWQGWQQRQQHVITINGGAACANLLIIPYSTNSTLALMVLRRAANLPVDNAHSDTAPFHTAGSIVYAARQQRAVARVDPSVAT